MFALGATLVGQAEVPELAGLVPDAGEYEMISKFDPRAWRDSGYQVDRSDRIEGN